MAVFVRNRWPASPGIPIQFTDFDSSTLSGPKYLVIDDNFLSISINKNFKELELKFLDPISINENYKIFKNTSDSNHELIKQDFSLTISPDKKLLRVKINKDLDGTTALNIPFQKPHNEGFLKRKYIESVSINQEEIPMGRFYKQYIDTGQSKVNYYRAFTIENISTYLAKYYGVWLYSATAYVLEVLLAFQLILFFTTAIGSLISTNRIGIAEKAVIPINFFDIASRDLSTFLGFFGTITSIWTALEFSDFDYSDFFQILNLIKMAVFTTVLGICVRLVFELRRFFHSIEKSGLNEN